MKRFILLLLIFNYSIVFCQQKIGTRALAKYTAAIETSDLAIKRSNLEAAILYQPDFVAALFELGKLHLLQGENANAKSQFDKILNVEPTNVEAHNELGNVYYAQEAYNDALNSYKLAQKFNNDFTPAMNKITRVETRIQVVEFYRLGDVANSNIPWETAKDYFSKAYNIEPDYKNVKQRLDTITRLESKYNAGMEQLRQADRNPGKRQYERAHNTLLEVRNINEDYKDIQKKLSELN